MLSRRDFLHRSTLVALSSVVPGFLAQTARAARPERDGRLLVVVQLNKSPEQGKCSTSRDFVTAPTKQRWTSCCRTFPIEGSYLGGGNDGINTVVPFKDEGYAKHRKTLRLPAGRLIKVSDTVGLHPAMSGAGKLLGQGNLAIIQGVGYPNPNRSHFESMAIWHSARLQKDQRQGLGWLGRAFDEPGKAPKNVPASVYVGPGELPVALRGRRSVASALTRPEDFVLDPVADPRPGVPSAESKDDLAAFVRRQTVDAYGTADRMAELGCVLRFGHFVGGRLNSSDANSGFGST
jgi:uncharacterized protein (DUF1501 family)